MAKAVFFHRSFVPYNGGEIASVSDADAAQLIAQGVAEDADEKAERDFAASTAALPTERPAEPTPQFEIVSSAPIALRELAPAAKPSKSTKS